ncbi:hypothetical protein NOK12_20740 [Nocardioides sp. OK12]|uniref:hypothetical protein n=1 Tax=Nocardioides sp. OK12 TaxID=2758661 RepID=UPI0021C3BB84|nr:hypothetical protein [Nocardioides sp. OK12]GHJ59556.1 hypothetical protein NOK12_20740 [Nocardioides sp. OK12]
MPAGHAQVLMSEQAWINSGINVAWVSQHVPAGIEDTFDAEWDELQQRPAWREWMTRYEDEVRGPFNYLEVADRSTKKVSRKKSGDLAIKLPASAFVDAHDARQVCREVIREVLATRAEMAGISPPPDLGSHS